MGSGKSSLGKKLAGKLQLPFIDLDEQIELVGQTSISTIFEQAGEDVFRLMERQQLHLLEDMPPHIVALGGGTPCFFDNMEYCNTQGTTVYLKLPTGMLASRLEAGAYKRPLIKGKTTEEVKTFLDEQLETRAPYYEQARLTIESPGSLSTEELVERVKAAMER